MLSNAVESVKAWKSLQMLQHLWNLTTCYQIFEMQWKIVKGFKTYQMLSYLWKHCKWCQIFKINRTYNNIYIYIYI